MNISLQLPKHTLSRPMDPSRLAEVLWQLSDICSSMELHTIGTGLGGEAIYGVTLGRKDAPAVAYVGGTTPEDWLTTGLLVRFITEYCRLLSEGGRLYGVHVPNLFTGRKICICPRLCWHTDIRHAFAPSAVPERFPEAAALGQYLAYQDAGMLFSLRAGEEGAFHASTSPRSPVTGRLLSRMSGLPTVSGEALGDWFVSSGGRLGFCASLGVPFSEDGYYEAYAMVREALFSAPLLI